MGFWEEDYWSKVPFSSHYIIGNRLSTWFVAVNADLDHLAEVRAQVSLWDSAFIPLCTFPTVELLDHMTVLLVTSWSTSVLFFMVAVSVYIPTNSAQGFTFVLSRVFDHIYSLRWYLTVVLRWYLTVVFICSSLMVCDSEYLFVYPLAICMSFLEKCLFKFFAHLLIGFFILSSLYILEINPLSDTWFPNIFSHSIGCLFILLIVSLLRSFLGWCSSVCLFLLFGLVR